MSPQGHATLRGNALSETLSKIHYDPRDLGLACKIPIQVFRPLLEIVTSIKELCGRSGHRHVMLSTDEPKLKYGNIVRKEHKVAPNQLTKIMNRDQTNADIMGPTFKHSAALSKDERVIKQSQILSDLSSQSTDHLQSHGMNAVECSAQQLLQQYHHEVSKQKPIAPLKRKRGTPQRREAHTDLCFARMHDSTAGGQEGRQPDPDQDGASLHPRRSKRFRLNAEQTQRRCSGRDKDRSKTLSKQLHSSKARATRTADAQRRRQEHVRKAALRTRHQRKNEGKVRTMLKTKKIGLVANSGLSSKTGRQSQTTNVIEKNLDTRNLGPQLLTCERTALDRSEASNAQSRSI